MSNQLDRFIRDNRDAFDDQVPGPSNWEKIASGLDQKAPIVQFHRKPVFRWSAAAAIVLLLSALTWVFTQRNNEENPENPPVLSTLEKDPVVAEIDPQYATMVAEFNQVIETKQKEIEAIETENPALFRQFAGDIKKLDSTYHVLRNTLPANPNQEQLLQAMISNLQMQIMILNQQLEIIQKVQKPNATKS
jgi:cytoskeletal protein RodZ